VKSFAMGSIFAFQFFFSNFQTNLTFDISNFFFFSIYFLAFCFIAFYQSSCLISIASM